MAQLDQQTITLRNLWLKHIFGPDVTGTDRTDHNIVKSKSYEDLANGVGALYDIICKGKFVLEADSILSFASLGTIYDSNTATNYIFDKEDIAVYIASLCKDTNTFWDDVNGVTKDPERGEVVKYSKVEVSEFKKTLLGRALAEFDCYLSGDKADSETDPVSKLAGKSPVQRAQASQQAAQQATANPTPAASQSAAQAAPAQPAVQPAPVAEPDVKPEVEPEVKPEEKPVTQDNKATASAAPTAGASGHTLFRHNAHGIISSEKVILPGPLYWVKGEFVNGGNTNPRIHVKPILNTNPLKIQYLTGQHYNDCILFTDKPEDAKKLAQFAKDHCDNPKVDASKFVVKTCKADSNGYVKVNTEAGEYYILAAKLHEEVEEEYCDYNDREHCMGMSDAQYEEYKNWRSTINWFD